VRKSSTSGITVAAAGGLGLAVGVGATYYTSADVDSLWAGTLSGVTIDNASLMGIDTTAGDLSYTTPNSNLSRGFAILGTNTLTLTGTNSYTGGTAQAAVPGVTVAKDTSPGFDTITLTVPRAPDAKKFARLRVITN
jgi:autotransporter-associated beta strand protein